MIQIGERLAHAHEDKVVHPISGELFCRKHLPGNKKNVYVYLTDAGRSLKEQLVPLAEDANRTSSAGLSPHDLSTVRRVLLAMISNLAQDEAEQLTEPANHRAPRNKKKQHTKADRGPDTDTQAT